MAMKFMNFVARLPNNIAQFKNPIVFVCTDKKAI